MASSRDVDEPTREYPLGGDGEEQVATRPAPAVDDPAPAAPAKPGLGAFARVVIFTGVVFALIVAMCLGLRAINVLPSFDNPFSDKTTDRSQPVLLQSMRDLSRYVAADGTFQVIVDLQESKDNIPDFLVNKRTLFVGSGTVEEYVDFGTLTEGAIKVNNADKSVRIELPAPQQGQAALDMQRSYVVAEERGLLNRIGDAFKSNPNQQQRVYQLAQQRITEAATNSGLDQRARDNTEKMLSGLLTSLGYTSVTVTFAAP
ncbi:DUF4230 domain-containing protein [Amorphoplanes nipponensis]|uniref:DUF4230 domain-containing protein n=1 Tax=Actinoplanes nipponensis TaxID=135950 RepID=A0A919JJE1_9ACTN|nr:DUF4230 domain-containing protein [Actinoplanes nipponensis]GIE51853.1 hypothetical protein Ani05nite_53870 [Actinoplanes nipponensis]